MSAEKRIAEFWQGCWKILVPCLCERRAADNHRTPGGDFFTVLKIVSA